MHILTPDEKNRIMDFLQGAVYCWCKNCKHDGFALRDLMGGDNYYWDGTPLYVLYEKYLSTPKSSDQAVTAAAIAAGWLLKSALAKDKRSFISKKCGRVRMYYWQ